MAEHYRNATNNNNEADRLGEEEKGFDDVRDMKPHQSVGFWHHKMSKVRKHVIQLWARTGKLRFLKLKLYFAELTHSSSPASRRRTDTGSQFSFSWLLS